MMLSVDDARTRLLAPFKAVASEVVALPEGLGRVLAAPVVSRDRQPGQAVSAMDGYAVRSADVEIAPTALKVVAEIPAGAPTDRALAPGECARIFTGGVLPDNADAIVIQEDTERPDSAMVRIMATVPAGHYVRPAGLDFDQGTIGIEAGKAISARDLGLAAAMNTTWLTVRRKPRIALLATGDELLKPGDAPRPGALYSSNVFALSALVTLCGGIPLDLGIAPDNREALARMAQGALGADLLVTSGGASVGDHDLVHDVLGAGGADIDFWKIAMRPGKPMMFGRVGNVPLLGLPGNPVSSMVCGLLFLRPIIRRMLGVTPEVEPTSRARLAHSLGENDRRQDYLRATLSRDETGQRIVTAFCRQDSSMVTRLAWADCLVMRPPHAPSVSAGAVVDIVDFPSGMGRF